MISQKEKVKNILLKNGEVSRNVCIRELYITRLSSIIQSLEEEGWKFKPENYKSEKGNDFIYYLIASPYKKIQYYVPCLDKVITQYKNTCKGV